MKHVQQLIDLASDHRVALISYRKPQDLEPSERHVEPYQLLESRAGDLSVKCWQLLPPPGLRSTSSWRCFRTDRILSVQATARTFVPRTPVTLADAVVSTFAKERGREATEYEDYVNVVEKCLLDGDLSPADMEACGSRMVALADEQVRAAHARVFIAVLEEVTLDGAVTDEEALYVRKMHSFLSQLGWAP